MKSFDLRAARRYAGALFGLARQHDALDAVAQDLKIVEDAFQQSPQLTTVLHHPRVSRQRKQELLGRVFAGQVREDVQHFLNLLVEKDRADIIPAVLREYQRMLDEHRREVDAVAATAVPMSDEQSDALRRQLEAATGYKIRLQTKVDDNLLGGLVVRVGDRFIDASVASRLQLIREQLKQVKVT